MSEKAIETDDEVIESTEDEVSDGDLEGVTFSDPDDEPEEETEDEAVEIAAESEESEEELEIVVEGEAEPTSEPVRKSGFYKRLSKVTGQRDAATNEAEEERLRREAVEEENKLLRLRLNQDSQVLKRPKAEDFDTDAEYETALEKYDDARIQEAAKKVVAEQIESVKGQTTQTQQRTQFEGNLREHYAQAEKLKIKDFEEAEDTVVDTIGNELLQYIINYHGEKSAAMVFHLSKNPVKAQELYDLSQNPGQAVRLAQRLTRLEDSLTIRPKHSRAASPEKTVDKGVPATDSNISGARFE